MQDGRHTLIEAEKQILGVDRLEIASEICKSWNFPKALRTAIRYCHYPSRSYGNELAYIVHVADKKHDKYRHNEEYRAKQAEYQRRYRQKLKEKVFAAYGGFRCACCGETEHLFLSLDHINNDGCTMRKYGGHPSSAYQFYNWLKQNNFPPDFEVLCMNCNHGKSRNNGVCPHKTRHKEGSTTIPPGSTTKRLEERHTPKKGR
jgi:hypothetical protein